jgi:hypothetical protein
MLVYKFFYQILYKWVKNFDPLKARVDEWNQKSYNRKNEHMFGGLLE